MKVFLTIAIATSLALACNAQPKVGEVKPTNTKDSLSYAIGIQIGNSFKQQEIDANEEMVAAGIRDFLAGTPLMTDEQVKTCMESMQMEQQKKMEASRAEKGTAANAVAEKFLNENKGKPGVMTTPSGLQYKVITTGKGVKPTKDQTVKVHYKGTLINGETFDSSYDRGEPAQFGVGQVIPGWTEALQMMPVGSKYMLFIPSNLAYGANGAGGKIGPNEALVFEVELIEIVK